MEARANWKVGPDVWADFVRDHPELGYRPGKWPFHNFLRLHRDVLLAHDAIRLAKNRFWIGHVDRFSQIAFDCATGIKTTCAPQSGPHVEGALVGGRAEATDSCQPAPGTTATGRDLGRSV